MIVHWPGIWNSIIKFIVPNHVKRMKNSINALSELKWMKKTTTTWIIFFRTFINVIKMKVEHWTEQNNSIRSAMVKKRKFPFYGRQYWLTVLGKQIYGFLVAHINHSSIRGKCVKSCSAKSISSNVTFWPARPIQQFWL